MRDCIDPSLHGPGGLKNHRRFAHQGANSFKAFLAKREIANREDFIQKQDVRI